MITPKIGFVVYSAHEGLTDSNGAPFINEAIIEQAQKALSSHQISVVKTPEIIATKQQARAVFTRLKNDESIDGVVLFTGSWIWAANLTPAIRDYAASGKGLAIWTIPGIQGWRTGPGLLMNGALREIGVSHEFVYGAYDDEKHVSQIVSFCRAYAVSRSMRMKTLALLGGRGMGQACGTADASQWMRLFGIDIDSRDTTALTERAKRVSDSELDALCERMLAAYGVAPQRPAAETSLRLAVALTQLVKEESFDFITLQGFPGIAEDYGLPYLGQSLLLDEGIATSSLGDCNTALLAYMISQLSEKPPFCGDVQKIDVAGCEVDVVSDGIAAPSLASQKSPLQFVERGIASEGGGGGMIASLVLGEGDGVLARLGRVNGQFELVVADCEMVVPEGDLQSRLSACGVPHWPHAFLRTGCGLERLAMHMHSEIGVVGYGKNLRQDLQALGKVFSFETVLP